mmetsp:Transcript_8407/g.22698  ORF Transcript_8407/g.22698 Transcript_8407/m.22698 type:complete len:498 (+) Transcript_8407:82-1575(+)
MSRGQTSLPAARRHKYKSEAPALRMHAWTGPAGSHRRFASCLVGVIVLLIIVITRPASYDDPTDPAAARVEAATAGRAVPEAVMAKFEARAFDVQPATRDLEKDVDGLTGERDAAAAARAAVEERLRAAPPPARATTRCPMDAIESALRFAAAPGGPCWTPPSASQTPLTIVTVVEGWPAHLAAAMRRNKVAYAARHGYGYCEFRKLDLGRRKVTWSKFPAMKQALAYSKWAFWIDADALFRDTETQLLPLLERLAARSDGAKYDAVYSAEVAPRGPWDNASASSDINAGTFGLRATPWIEMLLQDLYDYGRHNAPGGPSKSDQPAVNRYRIERRASFMSHAVVVPNGHFNSLGQNGQSDFISHYAGLPKVPALLDFLAAEVAAIEGARTAKAPGKMLSLLAEKDFCQSDKGIKIGDRHGYTLLYDRLFRDLRHKTGVRVTPCGFSNSAVDPLSQMRAAWGLTHPGGVPARRPSGDWAPGAWGAGRGGLARPRHGHG